MHWLTSVLSAAIFIACCNGICNITEEEEAKVYLAYLDKKVCQGKYERVSADFNYFSNITKENLDKMNEQDSRPPLFDAKYVHFDWDSFNNSYLKRQAKFYTLLDQNVDPKLYKEFGNIINKMVEADSAHVEICKYNNASVCGEEARYAMYDAFENSRDPKELEFYWTQNLEVAPRIVRPLYKTYVNISNRIANAKNYSNRADEWMGEYEEPPLSEFENDTMELWGQLKPIYSQFYSYIRSRLRMRFGEGVVSKTGPIPIHLMSLSNGDAIGPYLNEMMPYPDKPSIDVTNELVKQNYTVLKIVQMIEDYYISMGLDPLPEDFWKHSVFEMPTDRNVSCDPISFDFYNREYFRFIGCGDVDMGTITTFVHEMGHLHNFVGYTGQPCCFRDSPNPGLDEAIAETMVLAFTSFKNLQRLGLIQDCEIEPEVAINSLYFQFWSTVSVLPITLVLDLWRWNIFRNNITEENYNKAYWDLRLQIQGVVPPYKRSEEYLDPAIKIHILDDSQTLSYMFSFTLNYQNYEALCIAAGEYDPNNPEANPLHNCDLYGSKKAGKIWNDMYKVGASHPWTKSLEIVTGKTRVDGGSLYRYYGTFYKWLVEENKKNGEYIGWK